MPCEQSASRARFASPLRTPFPPRDHWREPMPESPAREDAIPPRSYSTEDDVYVPAAKQGFEERQFKPRPFHMCGRGCELPRGRGVLPAHHTLTVQTVDTDGMRPDTKFA